MISNASSICFVTGNIRDYLDSILLARQEAEADDKQEDVDMLSNVHVKQIVSDIFFGMFRQFI